MSRLPLLVVLAGLWSGPASAQSAGNPPLVVSFQDTVFVTDLQGIERRCHLLRSTADGIQVEVGEGALQVPWSQVSRIEKQGDPVWDGALKGAAVSTGLVLFAALLGDAAEAHEVAEFMLEQALFWGAAGVVIDALHVGRTTIYVAPQPPGPSRAWGGHQRPGVAFGARWAF